MAVRPCRRVGPDEQRGSLGQHGAAGASLVGARGRCSPWLRGGRAVERGTGRGAAWLGAGGQEQGPRGGAGDWSEGVAAASDA